MRFLVFSHVSHTSYQNKIYGYGPYVKEMNLWGNHVDELWVIAPIQSGAVPDPIDLPYAHPNIKFISVPSFQITGIGHLPKAIWATILVLIKGIYYSAQADHLHLRCPGNMGLLACFIQILFPFTPKTAKYAGNWDRSAPKAWSYRLQQWILNNTFLTKKMKVLAYGKWPDHSKNIVPFFTASYREDQLEEVKKPLIEDQVNLIFVGSMTPNKSPETAYRVLQNLVSKSIEVQLDYLGKGPEIERIRQMAEQDQLMERITFHGNVPAEQVADQFKNSHFLIFASQSEGWPKVVAESMVWGCVPVTTPVSCVPEMLGNGSRGFLIDQDSLQAVGFIEDLRKDPSLFLSYSQRAQDWSRQFTLESFEQAISELL